MARQTTIFNLIGEILKMPSVEKSIEVVQTKGGMASLVRTKDGNMYEVTIRQAALAEEPMFKRIISKKEQ